ncbi:spondin domain-containing protein [Sediminicola luteus]|uniref:spondin domain-containing protein n=1 Tax=Sediminicola luteus TaxID=319238 RepID=UPI001144D980|nr:spondin domain-containing protein [Sediminicola luteus]
MNNFKIVLLTLTLGVFLVNCSDDDDTAPITLEAGTLSGGPFAFTVDGTPDMVSGISLVGFNGQGDNQTFVITDDAKNILGLPPTIDALEGVNFDDAGTGSCYIYFLTYNQGLTGLEQGSNLDNIAGDFDLTNFLTVVRNPNAMASFTVTVENVFQHKDYFANGTIDGLIMPGQHRTISFNAGRGHYLSFATMFVQSNDLFFAPDENGLRLYDDNGNALTGDVTDMIDLWDAGTEVNEEPGVGANQAPRQSDANTGTTENGTVELIANVNDGYTYPAVNETIKVYLDHDGGTQFTLTLKNISATSSLPTPLAPGTWVINTGAQQPLFTEGEAASLGLEGIAEDGNNSISNETLSAATGLVSPFAPGAFALNSKIFTTGETATDAFEALAEDGNASGYDNAFTTPVGAAGPAPIFPGESYSFEVSAEAGDYLSLATMLVQSNDWVVGANGIALFEGSDPISGDITAHFRIYDSGTEVDEYPGAGHYQAPRQAGADTGMEEGGLVTLETRLTQNVPEVKDMIRITISAN